jgi:hypothetical protein
MRSRGAFLAGVCALVVSATSFAHAKPVDVFATGDAGVWATFAVAVDSQRVSLHVTEVPALTSDADYLRHFNVPGILRAGDLDAANRLVNR